VEIYNWVANPFFDKMLLSLACWCGLVNIGEEILMTMILPTWQHDVLSFVHA
jgi:hypothetical protein